MILFFLLSLPLLAQTQIRPEQIKNWKQLSPRPILPGIGKGFKLVQTTIPNDYHHAVVHLVYKAEYRVAYPLPATETHPGSTREWSPSTPWHTGSDVHREGILFVIQQFLKPRPEYSTPVENPPDCDPPHNCPWLPANAGCDCGVEGNTLRMVERAKKQPGYIPAN